MLPEWTEEMLDAKTRKESFSAMQYSIAAYLSNNYGEIALNLRIPKVNR